MNIQAQTMNLLSEQFKNGVPQVNFKAASQLLADSLEDIVTISKSNKQVQKQATGTISKLCGMVKKLVPKK